MSLNSVKPPLLTLGAEGSLLGGEPLPFLSGSLHYWRHPPELWPTLFDRLGSLGFEIVCSYVPWSIHVPRPGVFDLAGSRDLPRFCELADKRGFKVLLRPGPHINAEITGFGFPTWVLDDPSMQARGPQGQGVILPAPPEGFSVPSYASERFFDVLAPYFDALAPVLAPLLAPSGPVIGLQVDNENAFFFRTAPYDLDYHADAIARYRVFLQERYPNEDVLRKAYGNPSLRIAEADPPREYRSGGPETLLRLSDWVRFKETLARESLLRIAGMLKERCLPAAQPLWFHNYPPADLLSAPFDVPGVEAGGIDIQGLDLYPTRHQSPQLLRQCRALLGQSRFPFVPEFGAGASLWNAVLTLDDQRFTTPYTLLHGVRGINFYMAVERDRWYGAPILADGRVRAEHSAFFEPLISVLKAIRFSSLETPTEVLVLLDKAYQYAANACYLLSPVPPQVFFLGGQGASLGVSEEGFGLGDAPGLTAELELEAWCAAAARSGVAFALGDDRWQGPVERRRLVVAPTLSFISEAFAAKLLRWRDQGSTLVLGPVRPSRDAYLRVAKPGSAIAELAAVFDADGHRALDAEAKARRLEDLRPPWMVGLEGLEGALKRGPDGRVFLWLARAQGEPWHGAAPSLEGRGAPRLLWGEADLESERLRLSGWSVAILSFNNAEGENG